MKQRLCLLAVLLLANVFAINACTNFLVGKNASTDGSTMITYSADSWWLFGSLYHYPAAKYPEGAKLKIYEWDTGKYLGEIDQARETYNVIGNMNEHQLSIGETTYTGRKELQDTTGILDYGSLIYTTLQRAKTAREAIKTIVELTDKYGYYSTGESFSIADPNEVWIMELIGKGPGKKGIVWVAKMLPSNAISAHANQARITTFPRQKGRKSISISSKNMKKIFRPEVTVAYAHDVVKVAREMGYYDGKDADFSFSDVYNPLDFGGLRFCEARVWSFFRKSDPSMDRFYSYINGETKERMPLWIIPNKKLSAQDLKNCMRDHYEGTPLDMTKGIYAGHHNSVYRPTPLTYKVDGVEYYHERPVGTQQTGFTFVAQQRSWLPNSVGGLLWFGLDDATCNVYVPIYCGMTEIPSSMNATDAHLVKFSWDNAFWVNNWVANMTYVRYSNMMPDVKKEQERVETLFNNNTKNAELKAIELHKADPQKATAFLTEYSKSEAAYALNAWKKLGEFLMVKFVDGCTKSEENGVFKKNHKNIPDGLKRPGYSEDYNRAIFVQPNPERYRYKSPEEMKNRK